MTAAALFRSDAHREQSRANKPAVKKYTRNHHNNALATYCKNATKRLPQNATYIDRDADAGATVEFKRYFHPSLEIPSFL